MQMTRTLASALIFAAVCAAQQYTPDGDLQMPHNYREWIFLTSGIGLTYSNDPDPAPQFDNVFANPAAYQAFLKTGAWPDKTVLIKENRTSEKARCQQRLQSCRRLHVRRVLPYADRRRKEKRRLARPESVVGYSPGSAAGSPSAGAAA